MSNAMLLKLLPALQTVTLEEAFAKTFEELKSYDGFAGAIAIDSKGTIFHHDSHPSMVLLVLMGII
jgi:L-asparaginase